GEVDGSARGIFGCFFDTRSDPDKMNRPALSDDRPLKHSVFQESDARPHIHAALDAGAGNDPVADGGVRIAKEYKRILDQTRPIHSAPLAGVFLVEVAAVRAGIGRFVAFRWHRRDRAKIGVEGKRNTAAKPGTALAHLGGHRHRLWELAAQHPEVPQYRALARPEWGQLDEVDRHDIAGLGAPHGDRPGYRRQRVSITSRREWGRYRADVLDVVESAAYLNRKLLA